MMEYDLHTQNHESDENSSLVFNSCSRECQALIMRQLQSAQYPDICCDPGTAGFVGDRHGQKFPFSALYKDYWSCK